MGNLSALDVPRTARDRRADGPAASGGAAGRGRIRIRAERGGDSQCDLRRDGRALSGASLHAGPDSGRTARGRARGRSAAGGVVRLRAGERGEEAKALAAPLDRGGLRGARIARRGEPPDTRRDGARRTTGPGDLFRRHDRTRTGARQSWRMRPLPHDGRRSGACGGAGRPHAFRNDLRDEYHAGRGDRDRRLVLPGLRARDAGGNRTRWASSVPRVPLHVFREGRAKPIWRPSTPILWLSLRSWPQIGRRRSARHMAFGR